jgi:hypothetical protein
MFCWAVVLGLEGITRFLAYAPPLFRENTVPPTLPAISVMKAPSLILAILKEFEVNKVLMYAKF